jgi:hypothetical protein
LVIRSSLVNRSAKSVASNALIQASISLPDSLASAGVRSPTATASKSDRYGGVTVSGKLAGLCNYPNDSLHATVSV